VEKGIRVPTLPQLTNNINAGRDLFQMKECTACHGGPYWTSSLLPGAAGTLDPDKNGMVDSVLRDVGTLNPLDLRGDSGFDPPSLLNVILTPPYLHDGSMSTLTALLISGHPDPEGQGNGLTAEEIVDLVAFLRTIGQETAPIEMR
jgi:cytochrome c peroxidase